MEVFENWLAEVDSNKEKKPEKEKKPAKKEEKSGADEVRAHCRNAKSGGYFS